MSLAPLGANPYRRNIPMTDERTTSADTDRPEDEGMNGAEEQSERSDRLRPLSEIQGFVEDMFETFRTIGPPVPGRHPRAEMAESSNAYYIQLDLPGVTRDQLELETVGDELRLSGRRPRTEYADGAVVQRTERNYGRFQRSFRIPADADADGIRAKLEGGVLELRMPRRGDGDGRKVKID
jgi:HSP20 family protein